jgi:putative ABC transport system permease protein
MRALTRLVRAWSTLVSGRRLDRELDTELAHYIEVETERHVRRGLDRDAARQAALRDAGGLEQVKESVRDVRAGAVVETLLRDAGYGLRQMVRAAGFSLVVVLTLALGIGASVTTFSVMHAVLWRALPYPDAERLVLLHATSGTRSLGVTPLAVREIRARASTIDAIGGVSGVEANLTIGGELERVFAVSANDDALPMLGADPPALGRLLREREDFGPDGFVRAVVISDALWRRHFGADPAAIGRHIQVNNLDVEIVGVLRPGLKVFLPASSFVEEEDIDVWFPRGDSDRLDVSHPATVARLARGATIAQAEAELAAFARGLSAAHAGTYKEPVAFTIRPLQDLLTARVKPALMALGVAVVFVLIISCVNVTNLLLARAKSREREMAVRAAVGAGRARLLAQLLTESAMLAAAGGLVGLGLGYVGVEVLDWLRPSHLPRQSQIAIDGTVAAFAVALSTIVCIVCGSLPAFRASHRQPADPLRAGRAGASPAGLRRLQRGLVVAEVALSIVPLVAGGLMLRSFWNLTHAPIGFDPSDLISARIQISFRVFPDLERRAGLVERAIAEVRGLPGVDDVSAATSLPFAQTNMRLVGSEQEPSADLRVSQQAIFPGYLSVTRTPLIAGRDVTFDDIRQNRPVAIVDARLAARFWPNGAVGQRLSIRMGGRPAPVLVEIVGITPPVRATRVSDGEVPHVFFSYNVQQAEPYLVVRTRQSAATLGPALRRRVEALGTLRPVVDIRPMRDYVDLSIGDTRFTMLMLTVFAAMSLLLAGVGMYGTLAYLISQRTQEFGVCMALGATSAAVIRLVAREGAVLAGLGGAIGLAAALATARGLRGLLYGVAPIDSATIATVSLVMALVALVATAVPAWRASCVDPTTALRAE